jgi:hypothetical protein
MEDSEQKKRHLDVEVVEKIKWDMTETKHVKKLT